MRIEPIHPTFVCQVWPLVAPFLQPVFDHAPDDYSLEQLQALLVRGEQVLLTACDDNAVFGAATVSIIDYPASRVGFITSVGGTFLINPDVFQLLANWMKSRGCTKVRGAVRESVARLVRQNLGFEQRQFLVEKSL